MRPVVVSKTGVGQTAIVPVDYLQSPFGIGFGVVVSGTITYTVQHTFDNVLDSTVTPTWFSHEDLIDETANQDGNYAFPIRGIRLNNTAGTGVTTLTVLQGN
jgi:hypothetical protein